MAATARHQEELRQKSMKVIQTSHDPIEILRAKCLARGASGIKGLSRYLSSFKISYILIKKK